MIEKQKNKSSSILKKLKIAYNLFISNWLRRLAGFFIVILSVSTIISEVTLYFKVNASIIGILIDSSSQSLFMIHFLSVVPLSFLFYYCLYGLFNLKINGLYGIYKNNQTDSVSLLFLSSFMCKVGFPLCINFAQILKLKKKTILEEIVGSTELDPFFGQNFFLIYPIVLIILIILNLLNVYDKILRMFNLNSNAYSNNLLNNKKDYKNVKLDLKMMKMMSSSDYCHLNSTDGPDQDNISEISENEEIDNFTFEEN